mmetsp:Transcript_21641/g.64551  ORF Transcript_21641/g.64551 Transcript_21641/m.64551 type:complete len:372 (+) Transcript_21641:486-1601(+)
MVQHRRPPRAVGGLRPHHRRRHLDEDTSVDLVRRVGLGHEADSRDQRRHHPPLAPRPEHARVLLLVQRVAVEHTGVRVPELVRPPRERGKREHLEHLVVVLALASEVAQPGVRIHAHEQRVGPVPVRCSGRGVGRGHSNLLIEGCGNVGNVAAVAIDPRQLDVARCADLVVGVVQRWAPAEAAAAANGVPAADRVRDSAARTAALKVCAVERCLRSEESDGHRVVGYSGGAGGLVELEQPDRVGPDRPVAHLEAVTLIPGGGGGGGGGCGGGNGGWSAMAVGAEEPFAAGGTLIPSGPDARASAVVDCVHRVVEQKLVGAGRGREHLCRRRNGPRGLRSPLPPPPPPPAPKVTPSSSGLLYRCLGRGGQEI